MSLASASGNDKMTTPTAISGGALSLSSSVEKLTGKANYFAWRDAIEHPLVMADLWDIATGLVKKPQDGDADLPLWQSVDRKARSTIMMTLTTIEQRRFKQFTSASELLTAIDTAYKTLDLNSLAEIKRAMSNTFHRFDDPVKAHLDKMRAMWDKVINGGGKMDEDEYKTLVLASLPNEYRTVRSILSNRENPTLFNVEQAIEREEEILKAGTGPANGDKQVALAAGQGQRFGRAVGGKGRSDKPAFKGRCYNCDKVGHRARECKSKRSALGGRNERNSSALATPSGGDFSFAAIESLHDEDAWVVDSGSTRHLCPKREYFTDMKKVDPIEVTLAGRGPGGNIYKIQAEHVGKVRFWTSGDGGVKNSITLNDVLYTPAASTNLLSVRRLAQLGGRAEFSGRHCYLKGADGETIGTATLDDGMYKLPAYTVEGTEVANLTQDQADQTLLLWHRRFGHLNFDSIKRLSSEEMVRGLDLTQRMDAKYTCGVCATSKSHRLPFPTSEYRAKAPLELVHADLCGPTQTLSLGGNRYFFILVDDASR
jgi:hypothetical protein